MTAEICAMPMILILSAATNSGAMPEILVRPDQVVCSHFLGFGAEWDSRAYPDHGVTDEDFAIIARRVRWMRLPVARIMMLTRWCYFDGGRFDWDTPDMMALYRHLDLCQELDTTVLFTDWGAEKEWTRAPGLRGVDDPQYAEVIGTYLDYLINTKGYSCIRYFILTNEPNWEVGDWEKWKRGVENVARVFAVRGLNKKVIFTGSDTSQSGDNELWHRQAVDQLSAIFGAYDVHRYADAAPVLAGELETYFRAHWDYVLEHDPNSKQKPCIVGEAGMNEDAQHPAGNPHIGEYGYGVFMADYAVQLARAGSAAVSAWMLDDNSHPGFYWGLWSNKPEGLKLRPWFYVWSLLTRYFPPGSAIYRVEQPSSHVRILVARTPTHAANPKNGWTFCVVNRADESLTLTLRVPDGPILDVARFVYCQNQAKADADGFPLPVEIATAELSRGLAVACPGEAVVFYTTAEAP